MKNSYHVGIMLLGGLWLAACTQQSPAEVFNKGGQFFGRVELPSDMGVKMPQNPVIAHKYRSAEPEFSTAASVPSVIARPLDEPAPAMAEPVMTKAVVAKAAKPAVQSPVAQPSVSTTALPPRTLPAVQVAEKSTAPVVVSATAEKPAFVWPVEGKIVSAFGTKPNGLINDGINIAAPEGKPIWAAAAGEVAYAGNGLKGYGNMVIVRHRGGWMTAYAHASDMLVQKGDKVSQGDLIGYVGKTGDVPEAQLHFGIRQGKQAINPEELLPRRMASVN